MSRDMSKGNTQVMMKPKKCMAQMRQEHIAEFKEMQFINYPQCSSEYPSLNQPSNPIYLTIY
jgi:hypothetical protein